MPSNLINGGVVLALKCLFSKISNRDWK